MVVIVLLWMSAEYTHRVPTPPSTPLPTLAPVSSNPVVPEVRRRSVRTKTSLWLHAKRRLDAADVSEGFTLAEGDGRKDDDGKVA